MARCPCTLLGCVRLLLWNVAEVIQQTEGCPLTSCLLASTNSVVQLWSQCDSEGREVRRCPPKAVLAVQFVLAAVTAAAWGCCTLL